MSKRFVYWTSDGKRHWSPFLNITLDLSESAKFREADKLYDCHTRNELLALVRPKLARRRAKAQSQHNECARSRS